MEAHLTPGMLSMSRNRSLENIHWLVEVQDSPIASSIGGDSLKSQIRIELKRQSFLRSKQKDISSTMSAHSVMLVLLASVTFVGFLQPPGGLSTHGLLRVDSVDTIQPYVNFISSSFSLAVTGILVCMICIAFVIPGDSTYSGGMLVGEISARFSAVILDLADQKMLHSQLIKANNKLSLALRVARVLVIITKLFFITSLWSCAMGFQWSLFLMLPDDLDISWTLYFALNITFTGISLLYVLLLLWSITNSATDVLFDLLNYIYTFDVANKVCTCIKNAIEIITNMNTAWICYHILDPSSWVYWIQKPAKKCIRWIKQRPKLLVKCSVPITFFVLSIYYRNDITYLYDYLQTLQKY